MERSVLPIVIFAMVCPGTLAYAGYGFMEPLFTDADLPGVLKTYEINRKEYSTFRLYVELPTLNRNVEFRYLRKYENHVYHIEDFKATVRKFAVDNSLDTPEVENELYSSLLQQYSTRVMDLQRWCHQKEILGTERQDYRIECYNNAPRVVHAVPSLLLSAVDDRYNKPSKRIIDMASWATKQAYAVELQARHARQRDRVMEQAYKTWPGEHYALLKTLASRDDINVIVEIGTHIGMGALAFAEGLKLKSEESLKGAAVHTFDIIPWDHHALQNRTWFEKSDFSKYGGLIRQHISNIAEVSEALKYADILRSADLIFLDGAKNGKDEEMFLNNLADLDLCRSKDGTSVYNSANKRGPLVLVDDIRVPNMLATWRGITLAKMDITSLGHWSGTGIIDWCVTRLS